MCVRRMRIGALQGLVVLAMVAGTQVAGAACTATQAGGDLGSVPSQRVRNGPAITGLGTFNLDCPGVVLAGLTKPPALQARIVGTAQSRLLKDPVSGLTVPYQLTGSTGTVYTDNLLVINASGALAIGLFSGSRASLPVTITTTGTANLPAGTYEDTLTVQWTYTNLCQGLASVGNACLVSAVPLVAAELTNGTATAMLQIRLTVSNDCAISAPNLNFGTAPLPSGFPTLSQSITLACTRDMQFTVGLSTGSYPANGRRQMASGSNRLAYNLFKADSTVWGTANDANGTRSSPLKADGINAQNLPFSARVYPDQPAPPAGDYLDNVVVDVQF